MDEILEKKKTEVELEGHGEDDPVVSAVPGETSTPTDVELTATEEIEPVNEVPELNSTPAAPVDEEPAEPELPEEPQPEAEPMANGRMFSQDEVNELMGQVRAETRDRTFKYIYGRYGVENEDGLDELIGNAQRYDTLKENADNERAAWNEERKGFKMHEDEFHKELCDLKEKIALMESGIDKERYEDAKFILKGKGLDITPETIANELATHPEWKKGEEEKKLYVPEPSQEPQPSIEVPEVPKILGNENSNMKAPDQSEEDVAMEKYFRLK